MIIWSIQVMSISLPWILKTNMNSNKNILFLLCFLCPLIIHSQENSSELSPAILANFEFGYYVPGGDLSDRFGNCLGAGGGVEYITKKRSFIFGLQSTFYFGDEVKEDVLSEIRNDDGFLIGNNKIHANIDLRYRGLYIGGSIGKIFSLSEYNKRSGIRANFGVGYFQHKIRVQDDGNSYVPIVGGEYKQGWDRLSSGIALRQFVGYQLLSLNKLINFYVGFEFMQAFTQNRRKHDYKLMTKLNDNRIDLSYGIKIGWTLPFPLGIDADTIYY